MPTLKKRAKEEVVENQEEKRPDLSAQIAVSLIQKLGRPKELHMVRVIPLWNNNYRINVWVNVRGEQPIFDQRRISDSFFVVCNEAGDIVEGRPEIEKRYSETGEDMKPVVHKRPVLLD